MKKTGIIILTISFFLVTAACGQDIKGKLNIGLGGVFGFPADQEEFYVDGYFKYPAFFGNFVSAPGAVLYIDYKFNEHLWLGMHSSHYIFNNWKGDDNLALLKKPVVNMTAIGPSLSYSPGNTELPGNFRIGLNMSGFIYSNSFKWIESYYLIENEYIKRYKRDALNYGIKAGMFMFHEEDTKGYRIDIYYLYSNINSPLLFERSFNSVNLSFSIYMRKMKNIYYLYE